MSYQEDNMQKDLVPHRKRLRLSEFDYSDPNHVYFITVCARRLRQPFSNRSIANIDSLLFLTQRNDWALYAYCLMPDHLHLAVPPEQGKESVSRLLNRFKSLTTHEAWKLGHNGRLWQRSYYDHIARQEEDLLAICEYILANPVRRGLVEDAALWPYSGTPRPLPV